MSHRTVTGQDALNNFISTLYSQLFAAVVMLLNRGLANTNQSVHSTISILDYPGNNFNSAWIEVNILIFVNASIQLGFKSIYSVQQYSYI